MALRTTLALAVLVLVALPSCGDGAPTTRNGRVAFVGEGGTFEHLEIFTAEPDGSGIEMLTSMKGISRDPAWSPDGRRLALSANVPQDDPDPQFDLYAIDDDGSRLEQLTDAPGNEARPAWSPDGERIAFVLDDHAVAMMEADGAEAEVLYRSRDFISDRPTWSPDGERLAFAAQGSGGGNDIFVIDADGGEAVALAETPGDEREPDWSPDGDRLLVSSDDRIATLDAEGGDEPEELTSEGRDPTWSPDGTMILYETLDGVVVATADGDDPSTIIDAGPLDFGLDWQPLPL